jgi:hypothetical protein
MSDKFTIAERLAQMRAAGVPLSRADEERIGASIAGSLKALDAAVPGSLFDTEPLHFERVMRQLAQGERK